MTADEAKVIDLAIPRALLTTLTNEDDKVRRRAAVLLSPEKVRAPVFLDAYLNGADAHSYTGPEQKEFWKADTEQKWDDAIKVLVSYTLNQKRWKSEAELIRQHKDKPPSAPSLVGR